jgi:hypothetical protein
MKIIINMNMTMKINSNWEARLITMTNTKEDDDERRKNNL